MTDRGVQRQGFLPADGARGEQRPGEGHGLLGASAPGQRVDAVDLEAHPARIIGGEHPCRKAEELRACRRRGGRGGRCEHIDIARCQLGSQQVWREVGRWRTPLDEDVDDVAVHPRPDRLRQVLLECLAYEVVAERQLGADGDEDPGGDGLGDDAGE